jgi:hypothetical protein
MMEVMLAEVSLEGEGGDRLVTVTFSGSSQKDSYKDRFSITSSLANMASLSKLLHANCPTAAIYGTSEWAVATETQEGNLLLCLNQEAKMVMIEEDEVAFTLDFFSLPGLRFHDATPRHDSGRPCISLNWDDSAKVQNRDARLWEWRGGHNKSDLIGALAECPWVMFENVIL